MADWAALWRGMAYRLRLRLKARDAYLLRQKARLEKLADRARELEEIESNYYALLNIKKRLERENEKLKQARDPALESRLDTLERAWKSMTKCTDEFGNEYGGACGECVDAFDLAVLSVLQAHIEGKKKP